MENQKIGKKKNKLWMLQLLACMLAMVCMVSMGNNARYVPVQILQETIKTGTATVDTQGSSAMMYTTPMYKNGSMYNLGVLYDIGTNTVFHFHYTRDAIGTLPAIRQ